MNDFKFKELDREGHDTLDVIANADNFNKWMYQTIQPYCSGIILEIGSGIGNISTFFIQSNEKIVLSDIRDNYCDVLTKKYGKYSNVLGVEKMNIIDEEFDEKFSNYFNTFDTIFALNVVEHIEDDALAIRNCNKLLKKGGSLIILVPAYQTLYNRFDIELEHYRRYTINSLANIFSQDFKIIHKQYFNATGMAGWFFTGSILKKKTIPEGQMSLYNKLVPIFKLIDKVLFNKTGLSAIVIGRTKK